MPYYPFQLSESDITSVDINEVVKRLDEIAEDPENELTDDSKGKIRNEILFLTALQKTVLLPMVENVKRSAENLKSLAKEQKDLTSTILRVSDAAQQAQIALRNNGVSLQVCSIHCKIIFRFYFVEFCISREFDFSPDGSYESVCPSVRLSVS